MTKLKYLLIVDVRLLTKVADNHSMEKYTAFIYYYQIE